LGALDIEREDAKLFGRRLIGCTERRVREVLGPLALGATELHPASREYSQTLLAYTDQRLYLYFHNGLLDTIQWTSLIDTGGHFIWPPRVDAPATSDSGRS
jgi:hypothetical protein